MIKKYLFKVWITGLLAAPVIIAIVRSFNPDDGDRPGNSGLFLVSFIIVAIYGGLLSVLIFAVCYLFNPFLSQTFKNYFILRIVISLIIAAGVFLVTYFALNAQIALMYSICFFISGLVYTFIPSKKPPPQQN